MPNINLIYDQRVAAKAGQKKLMISYATLVASSVIAFGLFTTQAMQTSSVSDALTQAKKKHSAIMPKIKQTEEGNNELAGLTPRLETLTNAQLATKRWNRILQHLSRNTPENAWLTQLRCMQSLPTDPVSMTVTGMSSDNTSVGDMLLRLKANKDYEGVALNYTNTDYSGDKRGIKFEMTAQVAGTAEALPPAKEEKA